MSTAIGIVMGFSCWAIAHFSRSPLWASLAIMVISFLAGALAGAME